MKSWRRNRDRLLKIGMLVLVLPLGLIVMLAPNSPWANAGSVVLGAAISILATVVMDEIKRPAQARDLARALYEELADRVARCCFDSEGQWSAYLDIKKCGSAEMDSFKLRKFVPLSPIIYSSTAGQLAILEGDAPHALIKFYFRLAAWERDVENRAAESEKKASAAAPKQVQGLAKRVHQTLAPGLEALEALALLVPDHQKIEKWAIDAYDETREGGVPNGSLRERIKKLLAVNTAT